jgi:hypothetical protein
LPIKYRPFGEKRCFNCGNMNEEKKGCFSSPIGNTYLYFSGSTKAECKRWKAKPKPVPVPKTQVEISDMFNQLNTLAKTMREKMVVSDVTTYACYAHTMTTLLWVMGEIPAIPIEGVLKILLEGK